MIKVNNRKNKDVRGTNNSLTEVTENDILQFLAKDGKMFLDVQEKIKMKKREELLAKNPWKISAPTEKNKRWTSYVPDPSKTNGRKQIRRSTKEAVEEIIIAYWREQIENPTIEEVFNRWKEHKLELGNVCEGTAQRYVQVFDRHYTEFGKNRIKAISPEDFQTFLENEICKKQLNAKAFSNLKGITRGFLKYAARQKWINFDVEKMFNNMDSSAYAFKKTVKEENQEIFDEEEYPRVLDYLQNHPDIRNLGLMLMFMSGVRVGELAALKWEDITETHIKIRRTERRYEGNDGKSVFVIKETPKTQAGIREIALPESARTIFKQLWLMNPKGEYIFMENGERLKTFSFRNRLRTVCKKTHCVSKSPHKIRKTYASILDENHMDEKFLISQMGHTDFKCTEEHYLRNRKSMDTKVELMNSIPEFKFG